VARSPDDELVGDGTEGVGSLAAAMASPEVKCDLRCNLASFLGIAKDRKPLTTKG
jgi:hypothetical protein